MSETFVKADWLYRIMLDGTTVPNKVAGDCV